MRRVLVVLVGLALSAAAAAQPAPAEVRRQQAELRDALKRSDARYGHLDGDERNAVLGKQAQLLERIAGIESWSDAPAGVREQVAGDLDWIRRSIDPEPGERMVCERRQVLGSNRRERVCRSAARMEQEREAARRTMESNSPRDR